jgi:hypothetical protein
VLDLTTGLLDQGLRVRTGEVGGVEEREQPGEGRPELMRNGGREADPELVESIVGDD